MSQIKLSLDRYGFPIVKTPAELSLAKKQGHPNVRVNCSCGYSYVTATGNADEIIIEKKCNCVGSKINL